MYVLETKTENSHQFELCTRGSSTAKRKDNALTSTTSLFYAAHTVLCHGQCRMLSSLAIFQSTSSAVQDRTLMYNVHFAVRTLIIMIVHLFAFLIFELSFVSPLLIALYSRHRWKFPGDNWKTKAPHQHTLSRRCMIPNQAENQYKSLLFSLLSRLFQKSGE